MKYTIHFESQADKDIKKILKSAKQSEIEKLRNIVFELENHPSSGQANQNSCVLSCPVTGRDD